MYGQELKLFALAVGGTPPSITTKHTEVVIFLRTSIYHFDSSSFTHILLLLLCSFLKQLILYKIFLIVSYLKLINSINLNSQRIVLRDKMIRFWINLIVNLRNYFRADIWRYEEEEEEE